MICLLPILESSAAASDRTLIDQMSTRRRMDDNSIGLGDDHEDDYHENIHERKNINPSKTNLLERL